MRVDVKALAKVQQTALIVGALSTLLSLIGSNALTSYATVGMLLVVGAASVMFKESGEEMPDFAQRKPTKSSEPQ